MPAACQPRDRLLLVNLYDFSARSIAGNEVRLDAYHGQVCLIVNVASQCGFTPQYIGLEALYEKHCDAGFAVLGFPCDQFGQQEPGDDATILEFCTRKYNETFPLFAKVEVNGAGAHPLFVHLKKERPGLLGTEAIKWNFTKFLVDRSGHARERFAPGDTPEQIEAKLVALLAEPAASTLSAGQGAS